MRAGVKQKVPPAASGAQYRINQKRWLSVVGAACGLMIAEWLCADSCSWYEVLLCGGWGLRW